MRPAAGASSRLRQAVTETRQTSKVAQVTLMAFCNPWSPPSQAISPTRIRLGRIGRCPFSACSTFSGNGRNKSGYIRYWSNIGCGQAKLANAANPLSRKTAPAANSARLISQEAIQANSLRVAGRVRCTLVLVSIPIRQGAMG